MLLEYDTTQKLHHDDQFQQHENGLKEMSHDTQETAVICIFVDFVPTLHSTTAVHKLQR